MSARRYAALGAALAGAGLLVASTQTWLTGRSSDPVLAGSLVVATGSTAAPAAVGLVVAALAALVATLTSGPRARLVATVVLLVSAVSAAVVVAGVLLDPSGALAARAAERAGRTGPLAVDGTAGPWAWVALACAVALAGCAVVLAAASRGAAGLSRRFDRPDGARARSSWDAVSEGDDPTAGPDRDTN